MLVWLAAEYASAMDAVWSMNGTRSDLQHNRQNSILRDGCAALGYHHDVIPRNELCDHSDAGSCQWGCRSGHKQSVMRTWLQTAVQHHAQIIADCHVDKITIHPVTRIASGVDGIVTVTEADGSTQKHQIRVNAGTVVVAAGAIHR